MFHLTRNLNTTETNNELIYQNLQLFQSTWSAGLILFGVHLFLIGILMKFHRRIPKILWYITLLAGISYVLVHSLKLMFFEPEIVSNIEMILALPMIIGELGLAIWLTV